MKKILSWIFRDNLELNKHWWHRLIKVVFISLFCLIVVSVYVIAVIDPNQDVLRPSNVIVKNNLYEFTANYNGEDNENTIPKFFEQGGDFGLLVDNKIAHLSSYSLGKSICTKTPEKYLEGIAEILYEDYKKDLTYEQLKGSSLNDFTKTVKEMFEEDTSRKCFFFDLNTYDENLQKQKHLSKNIINYKPSFTFYLEITLKIALIALLAFIILVLIYYRAVLYVVYGNKK